MPALLRDDDRQRRDWLRSHLLQPLPGTLDSHEQHMPDVPGESPHRGGQARSSDNGGSIRRRRADTRREHAA